MGVYGIAVFGFFSKYGISVISILTFSIAISCSFAVCGFFINLADGIR